MKHIKEAHFSWVYTAWFENYREYARQIKVNIIEYLAIHYFETNDGQCILFLLRVS